MAGIELANVNLSYQVDKQELLVLNNLSLSIPAHQITVLLGKSGCGKTTLLRIVQGLEKNYQGNVNNNNYSSTMVFQEPRLLPWLNVEKNIAFGHKLTSEEVHQLLTSVSLEDFAKAFPHQLSGGMQARVALARAIAHTTDFLLMDEPFASLDAFTSEKLQEQLRQLYRKQRMGIVFVTHNIDEALRLGHRIVILSQGRVLETYHLPEEERDLLSDRFIALKRAILNNLRRE